MNVLSIHRCGILSWAYCDGECDNCRATATGGITTSSNGLCTENCQYKSSSGYCSLTGGCPYRSFTIYPNPLVYSPNTFALEKKPIKVKVKKVRRKR